MIRCRPFSSRSNARSAAPTRWRARSPRRKSPRRSIRSPATSTFSPNSMSRSDVDIGHFVGHKVQTIPGIVDTRTIITFKAFCDARRATDRGGLSTAGPSAASSSAPHPWLQSDAREDNALQPLSRLRVPRRRRRRPTEQPNSCSTCCTAGPPITPSWDRLMKLVQPTPDWLVRFNKNFDGVAGQISDRRPSTARTTSCPSSASRPIARAISSSCCSTPTARTPLARSAARTIDPAFFGTPSPAEQEAMAKAVKE